MTDTRIDNMERRLINAERRYRTACGLALAVVVGSILMESRPAAHAQQTGGLPALTARVAVLEDKTASIQFNHDAALDAPEVVFSGVNVRIVNGLGSTTSTNGAGNLIVGYNETYNAVGVGPLTRNGSHNVVIGYGNYFSSYGGIVCGEGNAIHGPFSSVLAGGNNEAAGDYSSVSGGYAGKATGIYSSVSGGYANHAISTAASVGGGFLCTAGGGSSDSFSASVSGGYQTSATDTYDWAAGGTGDHTVHGNYRTP